MSSRHLVAAALWALAIACTTAARAAPPLDIYGRLPGFEIARISPSGDHVALIGVFHDRRRLLVIDDKGHPIVGADMGDAKIRDLHWAGDKMVLVSKSDTVSLGWGFTTNKAELGSMIVIPADGGAAWTVFAGNPKITGGIEGFFGVRQRGDKYFGYFGGATLEGDNDQTRWLRTMKPVLYEVDLQTHQARQVASRYDVDNGYRDWLLGADGGVAATFDFTGDGGKWRIRNSGNAQIASGVNALGGTNLVGLGAEPGTVIYGDTDNDTGDHRWFQIPLAGGAATPFLENEMIGDSFFDRQSGRLLGYQYEGDVPSYHFFDPHQDKVIKAALKAFAGLSVDLIDWNDAFDRLIVSTQGGRDPKTWWFVDIRNGKAGSARVLGTSYALAEADVAPVRMIAYKAQDGLDISAVLTLPPGKPASNLPVVVLPHGGPTARDYPGFDWWAQAFASRGYAVLQPNFRGSAGYGGAFRAAGNGEWGRKMQSDISDGLAKLVKDGIVDGKRACIMGASYGGYAALAGVTLQHGLYRCAVAVAGVSDVRKMAATDLNASGQDPTLRRALQKEVGSGRDLDAVSPIHFAASADAPILLIHGKDDTVVDYGQSTAMASALKAAGKPVEFVTLQKTDHWLLNGETRLQMLQAALAFVQKYNPADP